MNFYITFCVEKNSNTNYMSLEMIEKQLNNIMQTATDTRFHMHYQFIESHRATFYRKVVPLDICVHGKWQIHAVFPSFWRLAISFSK